MATARKIFEFIEETLNFIALLVKPVAEGRWIDTLGHGADISSHASLSEPCAKGVGVISPIRQQNVSRPQRFEHIHGASTVVSLAFGELQGDGQAHGIDQGMDLGRQTAP